MGEVEERYHVSLCREWKHQYVSAGAGVKGGHGIR